ncbi:M81 family metallopeptidase [Reyranella sp. CPCC 100927]|uniref:M81 family metallopeptidase n=1 Tax=Reyranella sp. CPCC 100927 TaxID=2599616 RepID=UPI0011B433D9|nr:M81 family metallopeptidase [Reyranella sp. CPCC 100927]TWT13919.1 M81 family metallopeptidase [Reyranella sp. CPCC 100927]
MAHRVLIAQFMHETNTFSKLPTTLDDYRRTWLVYGNELGERFRGTKSEIGGLLDAAETYGWTLVPALAANATPSGKLTPETWQTIRDGIVGAVRNAGKLDGICLACHGAAVTETSDDPEGELLEAIRAIVGPDLPITMTLDLHANVTDRMARLASALISYRTYPHIDQYERSQQAAALVQSMMEGKTKAQCLVLQPACMVGADHGRTTQPGPMRDLLAKADAFEKEPGINVVSVQAGFMPSDISNVGPSIAVSYDPGAEKRAQEIARQLCQEIWDRRAEETVHLLTVEDAIAKAKVHDAAKGPLVIADGTDNPGGGAYGDATRVLKALIDTGIQGAAVGTIFDPAAVQAAIKAGVGNTVTVDLGGHHDPAFGAPLTVTASVRLLSNGAFINDGPMGKGVARSMGATAVLRIGGVDVVTISNRLQTTDLQVFLSQGIDPTRCRVLVVKSIQHFRAAYAPIAGEVVVVDSGALCSPDATRFAYTKLRRPVWPLDDVAAPF